MQTTQFLPSPDRESEHLDSRVGEEQAYSGTRVTHETKPPTFCKHFSSSHAVEERSLPGPVQNTKKPQGSRCVLKCCCCWEQVSRLTAITETRTTSEQWSLTRLWDLHYSQNETIAGTFCTKRSQPLCVRDPVLLIAAAGILLCHQAPGRSLFIWEWAIVRATGFAAIGVTTQEKRIKLHRTSK